MTAFFNIDKNRMEKIEDKIFSLGSVIGQIIFPIGLIMLLFLPYITTNMMYNLDLSIGYLVSTMMFILLGLGATASSSLDNDTIWHRLNRKVKVFGYK